MTTEELLDRCKVIAALKAQDYTSSGSLTGAGRHENFQRAAEIASWFKSDSDKPYVVLIAVKLARLASLLDAKQPQNESIEDTFIDLTNYCALWGSARSEESELRGLGTPALKNAVHHDYSHQTVMIDKTGTVQQVDKPTMSELGHTPDPLSGSCVRCGLPANTNRPCLWQTDRSSLQD